MVHLAITLPKIWLDMYICIYLSGFDKRYLQKFLATGSFEVCSVLAILFFFFFQYKNPLKSCSRSKMLFTSLPQIGAKNLTKREFIVEPSFFTSWTIRNEKCARVHVQQNKTIYLSIYLCRGKPF